MPGSKSNFLELELLDHVLGGSAYAAPGTLHVALFTAAPTDAGGGTEVTGGSYARVAVTNNLTNFPSANPKVNGTAITFPLATADWGTIVAFGIFDASTSGNLLYWGWLGNDAGKVFTCTLASPGILTVPGHTFTNGNLVRVLSIPGAALPTGSPGLVEGTTYTVAGVSGNTFNLGVNTTAAGAGLVALVIPKPILADDTASFAASAISISED
jgi:hypothetical protein